MKTIQEYLRECDRNEIINGYIYKYAFSWELMAPMYKDITCGEIVEKYKKDLNDYIDKLLDIKSNANEEKILMAYHSCDDVAFDLFRKEDLLNEDVDRVTGYGYELSEFGEVVGYYVADTYLTQYHITDLIIEFLHETSWTGYNHERLQEDIDKLKEAAEQAEAHKDDPDYYMPAEEVFRRIDEKLGFEREKKDPEQEAAKNNFIHHLVEYNEESRNIEIKKLRELLK